VDISSAKTHLLLHSSAASTRPDPGWIACARSGRVAVQEVRLGSRDYEYRIMVLEPDGRWSAVTTWSEDLQAPDGWSPDSSSLLMDRFSPRSYARRFAVASATSPANVFVEAPVADQDIPQAVWSSDGSHIYALVPSRSRRMLRLVEIAWPSRTETEIFSGGLGHLSVAEKSGDVVVLTPSRGGKFIIWRRRVGAAPEETGVTLSSYPMEAEVSPSGRHLAVVYGKEGVGDGGMRLCDLDDGSEVQVPGTVGKNIQMLHWALEGRALAFTIVPKGVSDWEDKATGTQVWLVRVRGN